MCDPTTGNFNATTQILGVLVLKFGVILHSVIIGLDLGAQDSQSAFTTIFTAIVFHQMFEGLGLGTRLAFLPPKVKSSIPYLGALAYSVVTQLGMAIGLGVRHSYNGDSVTAHYVKGSLDAVSAGILAYTGYVELIVHEFVFNVKMRNALLEILCLNTFYVFAGAGGMGALAKWV